MAEESQGIKLFGTMITLQSGEVKKGEKGSEDEHLRIFDRASRLGTPGRNEARSGPGVQGSPV